MPFEAIVCGNCVHITNSIHQCGSTNCITYPSIYYTQLGLVSQVNTIVRSYFKLLLFFYQLVKHC